MKVRTAVLVGAMVAGMSCLAPCVHAQNAAGPYVSLGAGVNYLEDQTLHGPTARLLGGHMGFNVGGIVSGALGYGLGNGIRIELQGDWSDSKFYRGGSNELRQYHGFANILYDVDGGLIGAPWLSPFVGVGGGYGQAHLSDFGIAGINAMGNGTYLHSTGTDGGFALQGIAGLSFNIGIPGLALTAEYRFTAMPGDNNFSGQFSDEGADSHFNIHTGGEFDHVAMIGVRYALFGAPPPPPPLSAPTPAAAPPPPAPPPVARTYLVFFDWDRADLSTRAQQIVATAAAASAKLAVTRINVNGYTDLSGTAAYNQRLSVRRAESVEAELVRDGVPKNSIIIRGLGEADPLVPTAPGVREPQNRRVEIIMH